VTDVIQDALDSRTPSNFARDSLYGRDFKSYLRNVPAHFLRIIKCYVRLFSVIWLRENQIGINHFVDFCMETKHIKTFLGRANCNASFENILLYNILRVLGLLFTS
jgi:hypothetical protein